MMNNNLNSTTKPLVEEIKKNLIIQTLHPVGYHQVKTAYFQLSAAARIYWDDQSFFVWVHFEKRHPFIIGLTRKIEDLPKIICSYMLE